MSANKDFWDHFFGYPCAYLVAHADLALIRGVLNVKEILTLFEFLCPYSNYEKVNK